MFLRDWMREAKQRTPKKITMNNQMTWQEEQAAKKNILFTTAQLVVLKLGGRWIRMYEDRDMINIYFAYDNGQSNPKFFPEISFDFADHKMDRIKIGYSTSTELNRNHAFSSVYTEAGIKVERPEPITVAADKDADKIANDIKRKLIPVIDIYHQILIEKVKATEKAEAETNLCILRLAKAGDFMDEIKDSKGNIRNSFYLRNISQGKSIRIDSPTCITLEQWTVTEAEMIKIIEVLKK